MIYSWEKKYKVADQIGVSVNTYSKYLRECIEMGLLIKLGSSYQFINLSKIIKILFTHVREWKHCRFFTGVDNKLDFKSIYERVRFSIAERNYKQQEFNIKRSRVMEEYSVKSMRRYIVSGKKHVSDLLGCCQSTGTKLLRKWNKERLFYREVITRVFNCPVNVVTYDILKENGYRPYVYKGNWVHTIGSKIVLSS